MVLIIARKALRFVPSGFGYTRKADQPQGGFTHGFVVEFKSKEDRNYYVNGDPVHRAFAESAGDKHEGVRVIDYEKGVY